MSTQKIGTLLVVLSFVLAACTPATPTPEPTLPIIPTNTTAPVQPSVTNAPPTAFPTKTTAPTAAPSKTSAPAPTATTAPEPPPANGVYIDDRSTAFALITSLFNAINRHEYLRAYSYWRDPAASNGTLDQYTQGYADTKSVDLVFGQISGEGAAGNLYYTVPVILKGTATNGAKGNFAACYVLHMTNPGTATAPPYPGMQIVRGTAKAIILSTPDVTALATACSGPDYPTGANPVPSTTAAVGDISANNYLDNRSGAWELVSSLLNAINAKNYSRAYDYWQNPATALGTFASYAAGYSNTGTITASFGTVTSDAGAGQLYYQIPVAMKVLTTSSTTQTFVGCYTLHLSQPAIQGVLPFAPLAITKGVFTQVNNSVDTAPLLAAACN